MNQVVLINQWEKICEIIKDKNYADWNQFSSVKDQLTPQAMSDGFLLLSIPTKFLANWVNNSFLTSIKQALKDIYSKEFDIQIISEESDNSIDINKSSITDTKTQQIPVIKQDILQEKNINNFRNNVIPNLNFSNFVIGESNRLAYSMAVQVAETPGNSALNPLFIYGKSGLGKTHLLRAIQNDILLTNPDKNVIYVDTNDLINDFTTAAASHDREKMSFVTFKNKYQNADVLLIDDVQFLQGKKQTLDIVFQIFNNLISSGKQIVLSADRSPKIIDLDERYSSRFLQGGTCDIQPPELETKLAIVKNYVDEYNNLSGKNNKIELPQEIIEYIAQYSSSNIRELKGAVTMVIYRFGNSKNISTDEIKKNLINHFTNTRNNITIKDIQKVVENFYNLSHDDLIGKSRSKNIANARQIAFYLCRIILDVPYVELGKSFRRDHSTVLYAVNKIEQDILTNRKVEEEVETLKNLIKEI